MAYPEDNLILVARSLKKAEEAKDIVDSILPNIPSQSPTTTTTTTETESQADPTSSQSTTVSGSGRRGKILAFECDQASLSSVRHFAERLRSAVTSNDDRNSSIRGLDVVCLNHAVLMAKGSRAQYSEDDLELTFQTNHLGSFLLMNLICDLIPPGGRVVLTSSGLHEGPSFGDFVGILDGPTDDVRRDFDMLDGSEFDYKEAYSTSKLCVTTFCIALNKKLQDLNRGIVVNCFSPGLITSTGLFRHQSFLTRVTYATMMNNFLGMGSTMQWGGGALAWMVLADKAGERGGEFWRTPPGSSHREPGYGTKFCVAPMPKEAADEHNQQRIWKISAALVGIDEDYMNQVTEK